MSVKGIVPLDDGIVLLHNERDEWELPGGRLEIGESPEECVAREILEETGLEVTVHALIDAWLYPVLPERTVLVLTYLCTPTDDRRPQTSSEHDDVTVVPADGLDAMQIPHGYKTSIARWNSSRS